MTPDKHAVLRNSAGTVDLFYFPACSIDMGISKKNTLVASKSGLIAKDIGLVQEDEIVITGTWIDDHKESSYDGLTAFERYYSMRTLFYLDGQYQFYWYSTEVGSATKNEESLKVILSRFRPSRASGHRSDIDYTLYLTVTKK